MARYIFTAKDFAPLRPFLEHPVAKDALKAVRPVKHFAMAPMHVEELTEPLPVAIQSRDNPEGVPLDKILTAVKEEVPSVKSIIVKNNQVFITHSGKPSAAATAKVTRILSNKKNLENLQPALVRGTGLRSAGREVPDADLAGKLLDDATPDAEWIRAFRQYAVKNLIKRE